MSLDSLNLTLSAITPPDGIQHTNRKQEILDLPNWLRINANAAGDTLMVLVVQSGVPTPADHDKIWVKTDAVDVTDGTTHYAQRGVYKYDAATTTWYLMAGIGVYVGATAPSDTSVLWLNTTESATYLKGLHYYTGAAWTLISDSGIYVGTTAPTNTSRPWLKTDDVTTVHGLYVYAGGLWVLKASSIIEQAAAPTGATGMLWLKTTEQGGLWRWSGSAWVNATAPIVASGAQSQIIVPGATAPNANERVGCMWAKNNADPCGLFWANSGSGYWESIHPICISLRYPSSLTVNIPALTLASYTGIPYSTICPTIGTAVFMVEPMMTVMLEDDTLFDTPTAYFNIGTEPHLTTFDIAAYNPHATLGRDIAFRVSAVGRMKIPF